MHSSSIPAVGRPLRADAVLFLLLHVHRTGQAAAVYAEHATSRSATDQPAQVSWVTWDAVVDSAQAYRCTTARVPRRRRVCRGRSAHLLVGGAAARLSRPPAPRRPRPGVRVLQRARQLSVLPAQGSGARLCLLAPGPQLLHLHIAHTPCEATCLQQTHSRHTHQTPGRHKHQIGYKPIAAAAPRRVVAGNAT